MLAYASRFRFWPPVRSPVVNREGDGRDAFPLLGPRPSPEGSRGLGPMCVHAAVVVTAVGGDVHRLRGVPGDAIDIPGAPSGASRMVLWCVSPAVACGEGCRRS